MPFPSPLNPCPCCPQLSLGLDQLPDPALIQSPRTPARGQSLPEGSSPPEASSWGSRGFPVPLDKNPLPFPPHGPPERPLWREPQDWEGERWPWSPPGEARHRGPPDQG